jgi:hypothetical protein
LKFQNVAQTAPELAGDYLGLAILQGKVEVEMEDALEI